MAEDNLSLNHSLPIYIYNNEKEKSDINKNSIKKGDNRKHTVVSSSKPISNFIDEKSQVPWQAIK